MSPTSCRCSTPRRRVAPAGKLPLTVGLSLLLRQVFGCFCALASLEATSGTMYLSGSQLAPEPSTLPHQRDWLGYLRGIAF